VSLLRQIQEDAVNPAVSVADMLRKCAILAFRLKHEALKNWVDNELNGYPNGESVPHYRVLQLSSVGDFVGNNLKARAIPIRPAVLPPELRKFATEVRLKQGVRAIETLVKDSEGNLLQLPWPAELVARYGDRVLEDMTCINAYRQLPPSALVGVLDTVRNRILSYVLEIESESSSAGELEVPTQSIPQEKLNQVFNTYILGGSNNVAAGGSGFSQEVIVPDPVTVLSSLSSLATVARFIHDFALRGNRLAPSDIRKLDAEIAKSGEASAEAVDAFAKLSEDFRELFDEQLEKAKDRLKERYHKPYAGPADYREAYDQAQYQICAILEAVKRHNSGVLPDDLQKLAEEFGCK
jgi:hypothetical protein